MKLLDGKVAIITGGTRGIGESIVKIFAKEGAKIIFTFNKSIEKAKIIKSELSSITKIEFYQSNAINIYESQNVVKETLKTFGRIDIIINNVGITEDSLLLRMSQKNWNKVIETNLNSIFYMTQAVVKPMIKQRNGSIINMSSIVGISGNAGQSNYAASKAGIIGFTKSIAKELGSRNIRCNTIVPGFISTEMNNYLDSKILEKWIENIALKKIGMPKDIANACLFLASDLSTYITGEILNVNGGMSF